MNKHICTSALMCHAPIVIPKIAGLRANRVATSTRSMEMAARHLTDAKPDVLVVLSPHTSRLKESFGVVIDHKLQGNFGDFGHHEIEMSFPNAEAAVHRIQDLSKEKDVLLTPINIEILDHGAMVPLYFMQQAGWKGKTVLISFPYHPTHAQCRKLGEVIRAAAEQSKQRWAILASGDMSHRLTESAPVGFHPRAKEFDAHLERHVSHGEYEKAVSPDEQLRDLAAEDVVDSLEVAASANDFESKGHHFLSYEGPFGVGYLVSILYDN